MSVVYRGNPFAQLNKVTWEQKVKMAAKKRDRPLAVSGYGDSRYLHQAIHPKAWSGLRCFIVAGGPSLRGFDYSLLKGELTIGINRAFEFFDPTMIWSMDSRFWGWVIQQKFGKHVLDKFDNFPGYKCWLDSSKAPFPDDITLVKWFVPGDKKGKLAAPMPFRICDGIVGGSNSGFSALHLALSLGANPIYLLGYDMGVPNTQGRQEWNHSGYPVVQQANLVYPRFIGKFEKYAEQMKQQATIINLNPTSNLKCFDFGAMEAITPIADKPILVSYYTEGNGYEECAKRLRRSLKILPIEHDIQPVPNLGNWNKNTSYKPTFMLQMMEKYPNRMLVWVDADAVLHKYPHLLVGMQETIGVHIRNDHQFTNDLLSGTVAIRANQEGKDIVQQWQKNCAAYPTRWDQACLQMIVQQLQPSKMKLLPAEYCAIFDTMLVSDPVIEHFQASRQLRYQ